MDTEEDRYRGMAKYWWQQEATGLATDQVVGDHFTVKEDGTYLTGATEKQPGDLDRKDQLVVL